jgi:predicted alpha/beta superfamily hydrolase
MPAIVCLNYRAVLLSCVLLICCQFTFPQFRVRFQISEVPPGHWPDSVFVAGNFNRWNPAENGTPFSKINGTDYIEIENLPMGSYQFKFTRGSWPSSECAFNGTSIGNREVSLLSDTTIKVLIKAWQDDFHSFEKRHTASPNVRLIAAAFPMPQLETTRKIWLYLPPGYEKNKKHYPVMYMHDGQNIFDEYTSGFGEWGVDECADSLIKNGKPACIIVGIENGPNRMNEYNPYDFDEFGTGTGDRYLEFIVKNLKPYIDRQYRTLPTNENTIIAGSSMGGLISYYAMLRYPEIFGKGGIFSPAFWTASEIKKLTNVSGSQLKGTLFFYVGGMEGEQYLADMKEITDKLGKNSKALIYTVIDPSGVHNEAAWNKWFHEFYKWVLANGFNNVVDLDED